MREVKLFVASSLDGYVARCGGQDDWLFGEGDCGWSPFLGTIDTVLMGRRTWELSLGRPGASWGGRDLWVFTRGASPRPAPGMRFTTESPAEVVARLRRLPGRDLLVAGGGGLVRAFLDADLVDRIELFIHPVVRGGGSPLFPRGPVATELEVAASETVGAGVLHLTYARPLALAA